METDFHSREVDPEVVVSFSYFSRDSSSGPSTNWSVTTTDGLSRYYFERLPGRSIHHFEKNNSFLQKSLSYFLVLSGSFFSDKPQWERERKPRTQRLSYKEKNGHEITLQRLWTTKEEVRTFSVSVPRTLNSSPKDRKQVISRSTELES